MGVSSIHCSLSKDNKFAKWKIFLSYLLCTFLATLFICLLPYESKEKITEKLNNRSARYSWVLEPSIPNVGHV